MEYYSLKMRAASCKNGVEKHISGAEKIVQKEEIHNYANALIERALYHSKGNPDFVNIKIENVRKEDILYLEALPFRTIQVNNHHEGIKKVEELLSEMAIPNIDKILGLVQRFQNMRGAMLLDVDTLERLEPDKKRGIRVTYMDGVYKMKEKFKNEKNHFKEAIVLATKVAYAPNIIGEICISDDPDYVTGYVASKEKGYVRIAKLKEIGSTMGGRIFLWRGERSKIKENIKYLEKQCVRVYHVKEPDPAFEVKNKVEVSRWDHMKEELNYLKKVHLYRSINEVQSDQGAHVKINGKDMLMLASNNYLGLSNDNKVKEYTVEMIKKYGVGSGGSRLITGTTTLHSQLEMLLADFKGTEASLVFNTGYMANMGIISAMCNEESVIFSDELNHASIIDGCRLSKAKIVKYAHNNMEDLEEKIKANQYSNGIVISDGVFSMDGDIVDLPNLVEIANRYGLVSIIDDAHGTGVVGEHGRGTVEYYHMKKKPDIIMGTLSKAIGSEGGFVCGSKDLIEYLKNKARSFIFSTSLSPATIAASIRAIELILEESERVQHLQENIKFFCKCLRENGLDVDSETAIIPILIGDENLTLKLSKKLYEQGYYISAIRYPTVKKGSARLRITVMSAHTKAELKKVAETLKCMILKDNKL